MVFRANTTQGRSQNRGFGFAGAAPRCLAGPNWPSKACVELGKHDLAYAMEPLSTSAKGGTTPERGR
jgi:hypothetical protein